MKSEIGNPLVLKSSIPYKISINMEEAERLRISRVPKYYDACKTRRVTAQPYDHMTEETPVFVECLHEEFGKKNCGECLGQCALDGRQYGSAR